MATDDFRGLTVFVATDWSEEDALLTLNTTFVNYGWAPGMVEPCHENPRDRDPTVNCEALEERYSGSAGRITRWLT